jgi:hypothetical protein
MSIIVYALGSGRASAIFDASGADITQKKTLWPAAHFGIIETVIVRPVKDDFTPYTKAEIDVFASFDFGIDDDWDTDTAPKIRTITGFTVEEVTEVIIEADPDYGIEEESITWAQIVFTVDYGTDEVKPLIQGKSFIELGAELDGFKPGEDRPGMVIPFPHLLLGRRLASGTGTPNPVEDGDYTAPQIDSLLLNKVDNSFSGYIEKAALVDADTAVLNDSEDSGGIKHFSFLNLWNYLKTKADAVYSAIVHSHAIADVTDLQSSLDAKQNALGFTPEDSANKGAANGYAELDTAGKVPVSQMPTVSKGYIVADIAARDALELTEVCAVRVIDATADATVDSGGATYWYDPAGPAWYKSAEDESMDLILQWENIQGKPTCSVADIEDAVAKKHAHTNAATLNAIPDHSAAEAGTAPVKQADGSILWAVVSGGSGGGSENIITKSITDADLDANGEKVFTWSALAITAAPIMVMLDNDGNDIECPILTNSTAENITINLQAIRDDNGGTLPGTYTLVIYAPADGEGFAQSITDADLDGNKQYIVTWSTLQITGFTVTQVNDNTGLKASIPLQWDTANEQITLDFSAACSANGGTLPGTFLFLGGRSGEYVDVSGKADKVGADDLEITDATKGVILRSSNGTRFRITIDDNGTLTTEDLTA